ncbi:MAG: DUF1501 domain-containing protein [Planctomycetota bacterium]|jgi:uncharacterized protein (DUF1501 family)
MSCAEKRAFDRRSFLKGGLAASAAAMALPTLFSRAVFAAEKSDRVLVLIQLDGGNDGLNTVIPYGDDAYFNARPSLGIGKKRVVTLDDHIGLHPSLAPLRAAWEDGALGVVQGVGYPDPNRSHFASTDIWQTASRTTPDRWNGWLGRALDRDAGREVPGLQLDPGPLSLALVGEKVVVPSVADANRFRVAANKRELVTAMSRRPRKSETAEFIRRSADQSYKTAARIETALKDRGGRDAYPGTALANRLWQVARLVEANLSSRVYAVRLSGFDTHSRQAEPHAALLAELGGALGAFQADLKSKGLDKRVLCITYSEFGRRVKENRSLGTDHGAAAPMFVMGGSIKGGLHGAHPALDELVDGDLRHHTDFRQVYATVLDRWIRVDAKAVLGGRFAPVGFL